MPNKKARRTPKKVADQKIRPKINKIKKYEDLIEEKPKDPQVKIWKQKLEEINKSRS